MTRGGSPGCACCGPGTEGAQNRQSPRTLASWWPAVDRLVVSRPKAGRVETKVVARLATGMLGGWRLHRMMIRGTQIGIR